jgi:hypothetical protein
MKLDTLAESYAPPRRVSLRTRGIPGYWLGTYDLSPVTGTVIDLDASFPSYARCAVRCTARRQDGQPCKAWSVGGTAVCRVHGGMSRKVRAAGQRRLAIACWAKGYSRLLARLEAREQERHREEQTC